MKRWQAAFALLILFCSIFTTSAAVAGGDADGPELPPERFFTPDTLAMVRIDFAAITGPMLLDTLRGVFDAETLKKVMEDEFTAGVIGMAGGMAGMYDLHVRVPFEGAGGSSMWVVAMSGGNDPKSDRVYMLLRLGRALGMKPPENFEEWIATEAGIKHVAELTNWVRSLDPTKLIGGQPEADGEKTFDLGQIERSGEYLVCRAPGVPLPDGASFDPTTMLAFTEALHVGSEQHIAWAIMPHKRWRDRVNKQLADSQAEYDEKKKEGKPATMRDVLSAKMLIHLLNNSQWTSGWFKPGGSPEMAMVVLANTEEAAQTINAMYVDAILSAKAVAGYQDGNRALRNFLNPTRDKTAEVSYLDYVQAVTDALKLKRQGRLIGLVIDTAEFHQITRAQVEWENQKEQLEAEQEAENEREDE